MMGTAPWDPSPRGGPRGGVSELRSMLLERIQRSRHTGIASTWGFVLAGACVTHGLRETGWLYAITPTDAAALTQGMVRATEGRALFLLGCARTVVTIPAVCDARFYHDSEPIPAVEINADLRSTWPRAGGGRLEATVEWWHAARTPITVLTDDPIPGWPR